MKLKKLLLTLVPISAIAIATPIVLTSCSTNAQNPSNPGSGNGSTGQDGKLTPDSTNDSAFMPANDGLYKKVEETVKAGKKGEENNNVDTAFTAYTSPTEQDIKDAINMWSFNKWFESKKISGVKEYISNLTEVKTSPVTPSSKAGETTWNISFKYKFQIAIESNGATENILAERTFDAKNIKLTSTVAFNTTATLFMVNGKSELESKPEKTLYADDTSSKLSNSAQKVKEFLDAKTSQFDSKVVYKSFVVQNKGIQGQQAESTQKDGEWLDSIEKPTGVVELSEDKKTITVDLKKITDPNKKWYDLDKDSTEQILRKAVYGSETAPTNGKGVLTETFKALIFKKESFNKFEVSPSKDTTNKIMKFEITLTKTDDKTTVTLNLNFKNPQGM